MKNNPETRFQEFFEAWNTAPIEDCFFERKERSGEGEMISVTINTGIRKAKELDRTVHIGDTSNYKVVRHGDIAYNSMRMWQGASGYSPYDGILSPAYTVIIPKKDIISEFFASLFKQPELIHTFELNSQGLTSDTWNLKFEKLKKITVSYPSSPEEQHKIAQFFSRLDSLITAEDKKLERLKTIKTASLEKMFPKQGESIPEVRFRGFSEEWIKYSFDDTFSIINDSESNIPKTEYQNNGKYPVIDQSKIFIVGYTNKNKPIIPVNGYIIFGDHTREFKYVNFPFYSGADGTQILSCKNDKHISKFIFYNCLALKIPNTGYNRHLKYLKEAILMCPEDINEQHIIADFFSRLDALISAQEQKVKGLRSLKKSFLEKMFVSTPK